MSVDPTVAPKNLLRYTASLKKHAPRQVRLRSFALKVRGSNVALCAVWIGAILVLWQPRSVTAYATAQRNREQAQKLWDDAINAKGGRDRLYAVSSLLIWYEETSRNFLGIAVHRGHVERLFVFPVKLWSWDDGLPPPFHLSVDVMDLDRDFGCRVHDDLKPPMCGNARKLGSREGIDEAQYLYLMETRWIKPIPISVRKDRIGLKTVDVLETQLEDKRILYFLNRKTHLPQRVTVFSGNSERARLSLDLSEYLSISGIQMPGKQKRGRINFLLNPQYDESVFTRPRRFRPGQKHGRR